MVRRSSLMLPDLSTASTRATSTAVRGPMTSARIVNFDQCCRRIPIVTFAQLPENQSRAMKCGCDYHLHQAAGWTRGSAISLAMHYRVIRALWSGANPGAASGRHALGAE